MLLYLLYFSSLYLLLSYYYLLLSYYAMRILCYISLVHVCMYSNTVFYACLCLEFIDTHVLIYARHLEFVSPLARGVLTPLDPHVQVLELRARGFSWLLT